MIVPRRWKPNFGGGGVVLSQVSESKPGAPMVVPKGWKRNFGGEGVVLSQVSKSRPGAPMVVLRGWHAIWGRESQPYSVLLVVSSSLEETLEARVGAKGVKIRVDFDGPQAGEVTAIAFFQQS